MNLKKCFLIIILFVSGYSITAQDNHFSQFYHNPVEVNPAFLSTFQHPRVSMLYRNQWSNIIRPYKTFQAAGFYPFYNGDDQIGTGGISFLNQTSGKNGLLSTNRITALSSFRFALDQEDRHVLHFSVSGNYVNRRVNTSNLTSGNQWYNNTYHSDASLGEDFEHQQANYLTLTNSFLWSYTDNKGNRKGYAGFSVFNVNEPDLKFIAMEDEYPLRWSLTGGYKVIEEGQWSVFPRMLWMQQAGINEWTGGSNIYYDLNNQSSSEYLDEITLGLGGYYRWDDAFYLTVSARQEKYNAGVSYDINTSGLKQNLGYNSSIEFFLTWKFTDIPEQKDSHQKKEKSGKSLVLITVKDSSSGKRVPGKISIETDNGKTVKRKKGKRMTVKADPRGKYRVKVEKDGYKSKEKALNLDKNSRHMFEIPVLLKQKPELSVVSHNVKVVDTTGKVLNDVSLTVKDSAGTSNSTSLSNGVLDTNLVEGGAYQVTVNKEGYYQKKQKSVVKGDGDKIVLNPVPEKKPKVLKDVHFKPGTADLDSSSFAALNRITEKLRQNPEYTITITGYTDSTNTKAFNKQLSKKRAKAVASYLIDQDISRDRIKTKGKGETDPIAPNNTEEGRERNRRVEINLSK